MTTQNTLPDFSKENRKALVRHAFAAKNVTDVRAESACEYKLEAAKRGGFTLSVRGGSGKLHSYHSRYAPVAEAKKLVASVLKSPSHVIMLGFGLGYALEEVLQRLTTSQTGHQVIIVEPDVEVFRHALRVRDMRSVLADPGIDWCIGMTVDQIGDLWNNQLDWTSLNELAILEHPPSLARFSSYFQQVKDKIRALCNRSKGNLVTMMHAGFEFLTNNFLNIHSLLTFPGVGRLFDKFSGRPAVIVAAGPSLEKNIHLLKEIKDSILIVAVDTSFRQLVAHGIRPDIVCAADPSYLNSLDFVGVEDEKDVILAVEPMTHPDILTSFKGPKMVMTFGGGLDAVFKPFREDPGKLVCWGSIATTAFDMVRRFACDPIIFVGLDLSFQDGRLYARGSYSDDIFYDRVHGFTSLEQENVEYILKNGKYCAKKVTGETIYTDRNMHLYRSWFEDQFKQTRQRIINATEGGIVNKFVEVMPLQQALKEAVQPNFSVSEILKSAMAKPVVLDSQGLLKQLKQILQELRLQEQETRRATGLCRKVANSAQPQTLADKLLGPTRSMFQDILAIHDYQCRESILLTWFTSHQAKFLTRHTIDVKSMQGRSDVTVSEWLKVLTAFAAARTRFYEYQLPLLESAVESVRLFVETPEGKSV